MDRTKILIVLAVVLGLWFMLTGPPPAVSNPQPKVAKAKAKNKSKQENAIEAADYAIFPKDAEDFNELARQYLAHEKSRQLGTLQQQWSEPPREVNWCGAIKSLSNTGEAFYMVPLHPGLRKVEAFVCHVDPASIANSKPGDLVQVHGWVNSLGVDGPIVTMESPGK
jgi:hypothetical protein